MIITGDDNGEEEEGAGVDAGGGGGTAEGADVAADVVGVDNGADETALVAKQPPSSVDTVAGADAATFINKTTLMPGAITTGAAEEPATHGNELASIPALAKVSAGQSIRSRIGGGGGGFHQPHLLCFPMSDPQGWLCVDHDAGGKHSRKRGKWRAQLGPFDGWAITVLGERRNEKGRRCLSYMSKAR